MAYTPLSVALAAVAALAPFALERRADGALSSWIATRGGDFHAETSWKGPVPGAADTARFGAVERSGPFVVTATAPVTVADLLVESQSPTFSFAGAAAPLDVLATMTIRPLGDTSVAATVVGTDLAVGGVAVIGGAPGTLGTASFGLDGGATATFVSLTAGTNAAPTAITVTDGILRALDATSPFTIGDGGVGVVTVGALGLVDANGTTVQLGANAGNGQLEIAGGAALDLAGGTLRIAGALPAPASAGSGTAIVHGAVTSAVGGAGVLIAPEGGVGLLDCRDGADIEVPVVAGPGSGKILCAGHVELDSLTLRSSSATGITASGPETSVYVEALVFDSSGGSGSPFVTAMTGAALAVDAVTNSMGTVQVTAHSGGSILLGGSLALTSPSPGSSTLSSVGPDSVLSLAGVGTLGGAPVVLSAHYTALVVATSISSGSTGRMQIISSNAAQVAVVGPVTHLGQGGSSPTTPALRVEYLATLMCTSLELGPNAPLEMSWPFAPAPITASSAIVEGPVKVIVGAPLVPVGDYPLIVSSDLTFQPSGVTVPVLHGYPALLVADGDGLTLRVIDHIDSIDVAPSIEFLAGTTIEVPVSVTADGVTVDASDSVVWTFDDPIVLEVGPSTFLGLGAGTTTATVSYGASSTTVEVTVLPVAPSGLSLVSGLPVPWGDEDSGANTPELFNTIVGIRPRGVSADGSLVAFSSAAGNLAPVGGGGPNSWNVLLRDLTGDQFDNLSATIDIGLDDATTGASMSRDGRFVVFGAPSDGNGIERVILVDRMSGETTFIDVTPDGSVPNGDSREPRVSDDGRFVLFGSDASDLVPDDTNGTADVFLRDRDLGITTRVSLSLTGGQLAVASTVADLSTDGRYALFRRASFGWTLAYRHDRVTGETALATPGLDDPTPQVNVLSAQLSDDGRRVAFVSTGLSAMADVPLSPMAQLYVRDLDIDETVAASVTEGGEWAEAPIDAFAIDADARHALLATKAKNLAAETIEGSHRLLYRKDLLTGAVEFLSAGALGPFDADIDTGLALSASGAHAVFSTIASNVLPADIYGFHDVYRRELTLPVMGDLDGDGAVGPVDLGLLLGAWGTPLFDLDGDGAVGAADVAILLGAWT